MLVTRLKGDVGFSAVMNSSQAAINAAAMCNASIAFNPKFEPIFIPSAYSNDKSSTHSVTW